MRSHISGEDRQILDLDTPSDNQRRGILDQIQSLSQIHQRISQILLAGWLVTAILAIALLCLNAATRVLYNHVLYCVWIGLMIASPIFMVATVLHYNGLGMKRYWAMVQALCSIATLEDMGHLINYMEVHNDTVEVYNAVARLLKQVTVEDEGILSPHQMSYLMSHSFYGWLRGSYWIGGRYARHDLASSALYALARLGGSAEAKEIQQIARTKPQYGGQAALITDAKDALQIIEARLRHRALPETLLRPSQPVQNDHTTLLRSADKLSAETRSGQLLRLPPEDHKAV